MSKTLQDVFIEWFIHYMKLNVVMLPVKLLCIIRDIIRKEKWGTVISPQKHDLWTTYALYPDGFTPNSRKKKLWRDFFSCMNPDFFFKSFQILFYVWKKKFSGFKRILTRIFIFMCETFSFMKPDFKKGYFFIIEKNIYKFSGKSLSSCEKISGDFFFPCLEPGNTMFFLFFMYETERQKVFCIYFFHAWKRIFLFFCVKQGEKQAVLFTALSERLLYYCLVTTSVLCDDELQHMGSQREWETRLQTHSPAKLWRYLFNDCILVKFSGKISQGHKNQQHVWISWLLRASSEPRVFIFSAQPDKSSWFVLKKC